MCCKLDFDKDYVEPSVTMVVLDCKECACVSFVGVVDWAEGIHGCPICQRGKDKEIGTIEHGENHIERVWNGREWINIE